MPVHLEKPIIYLITSGETEFTTTPASDEFSRILKLIEAAVAARVTLLQLREKRLSARVLYDLAQQAANIIGSSSTHLLVNDRADVARSTGALGVHLTTKSLEASVIRATFGDEFLIGLSTHNVAEACDASSGGADFAVFGPVFETDSKRSYGLPLGIQSVQQVTAELGAFPILALGGVQLDSVAACFHAGASGIAAIRLLNNPTTLASVCEQVRETFFESAA